MWVGRSITWFLSLVLAVQTPLWCCCVSAADPASERHGVAAQAAVPGADLPPCHARALAEAGGGSADQKNEPVPCEESSGPCDGDCSHADRVLEVEPAAVMPTATVALFPPLPVSAFNDSTSAVLRVSRLWFPAAALGPVAPLRSLYAQHVLLTV